jgi:hypothetical protein
MNTPIPNDKIERIAASDNYIHSLSDDKKLEIVEEINRKQPLLLFEASMLRQLKVPDVKIEVIFNYLLILYDYFTERGKKELPMVTKEIIKDVRGNIIWMLKLFQKEGHEEGISLIMKGYTAHPRFETLLCLSSLMQNDVFKENRDENGYCVFIARVLLDCFTKVAKQVGVD